MVLVLFTFYIRDVLKLNNNSGAKRLNKPNKQTKNQKAPKQAETTEIKDKFCVLSVRVEIRMQDEYTV